MANKQIEKIDLDNLILDIKNPRLPDSFKESDRSEKNIINWMLEDASIIELMLAIGENGFFIGESLLVIKDPLKEGKCIVVEGNRRLTSLKLLQNPSLANIHNRKIDKVLDETEKRPTKIPCIKFDSRDTILEYLGFRHITGIKSWGLIAKARYLNSLLPTLEATNLTLQARELAKKIGSRTDYVKKILVSYQIYEIIQDNSFYKIPNLDETTFYFNYIVDSLNKENIRKFLEINLNSDTPLDNLERENLEQLINWFFRKNENNKSAVLGNSEQLGELNKVLGNTDATKYFCEVGSLKDSLRFVTVSSDNFHHNIQESLRVLKNAQSIIHNVKEHNNSDIDVLREIVSLCRIMRDSINGKKDEWE